MFPILLANLVSQAVTPRSPRRRVRAPAPVRKPGRGKPLNLALQGGGAHGAFTWGVLDQLLDPTLEGRCLGRQRRQSIFLRCAVQHLKILKEAGLIREHREGRKRLYEINPEGLDLLRHWLNQFKDGAGANSGGDRSKSNTGK